MTKFRSIPLWRWLTGALLSVIVLMAKLPATLRAVHDTQGVPSGRMRPDLFLVGWTLCRDCAGVHSFWRAHCADHRYCSADRRTGFMRGTHKRPTTSLEPTPGSASGWPGSHALSFVIGPAWLSSVVGPEHTREHRALQIVRSTALERVHQAFVSSSFRAGPHPTPGRTCFSLRWSRSEKGTFIAFRLPRRFK